MIVYSTDFCQADYFENFSGKNHNIRCIDGSVTGCCNCVGYCEYDEHPGYLTSDLRAKHNCVKNECMYYTSRKSCGR